GAVDTQEPIKDNHLTFGFEDERSWQRSFTTLVDDLYRDRCIFELGRTHLARKRTATDKIVELLVIFIAAGRFECYICRANRFVGLLSTGAFGLKFAYRAVLRAV